MKVDYTMNNDEQRADPVETGGRFSGMGGPVPEHGLRWKVLYMTPPLAERLLEKLHPNQRNPKAAKIQMYAADMASDRWRLWPDPIVIDEDGYLSNGSNRLRAVLKAREAIAAGALVPMVICYGAPRQSIVVADTGTSRNVRDAAQILGRPVSTEAAAVARRMLAGMQTHKIVLSTQQVLDAIDTYREAIDFTFTAVGRLRGGQQGVGIINASSRAACSRAWYTKDKARILQFLKTLVSGLPDDPKGDMAAIMYRNWMLDGRRIKDRKTNKGGTIHFDPRLAYALCETALGAFLDRKQITSLIEPTQELFPIPDPALYRESDAPEGGDA